jgi:hypothetical protein
VLPASTVYAVPAEERVRLKEEEKREAAVARILGSSRRPDG